MGRVPCRLTLQSRVWRVHVAAGRCWLPTGVAASCSQARQYRLPLCTSQCTARGCCRLRRGCARRQVRAANPMPPLQAAVTGTLAVRFLVANMSGCQLQPGQTVQAAVVYKPGIACVLPYVEIEQCSMCCPM